MTSWQNNRAARDARIAAGAGLARGKVVEASDATRLLEAVIRPGDRVCLEGDNQKQADLLSRALLAVDLSKVNDLHMVQSGVVLPEHLDLFDRGVAKRLDYAYSGPQSARIARMLFGGKIELGAVHTYLELFARYFIDLTPHVALIAAVSADRDGNLYTGPNTEDTPTVVEATAFKDGVVIAQVNEIVETVPRVDIPADRVHFVVKSDKPFFVEPLFTRDPAAITEGQILTAMLAIKGIYAPYGVQRINHGIGFSTAAIELLLPTFGERLGLKGRIATHFALNPHPALTGSGGVIAANVEPRKIGTSCFGRPAPEVDVRIVDDSGNDAPVGTPGELLVRRAGADPRYGFFREYLKNEAATAEAWDGGWLHTGDIVSRDADGDLHFVDRKKNVIRRSGENIAAVEVESVLNRHPAIRQAAVAATPDQVRGDEVAAVIIAEEAGADRARAEEIVRWSLEQMAYYKAPGWICFVDSLPLTATEKIQRGGLKDFVAKLMGDGAFFDLRDLKKRQV
ncbi:malonate decarboxylase subunit alpha [Bradyrhizobium liaoningense]|uniref:malonate decarboxylase subunit alpha n=1 Tax=Bradyrhizobium liaoningense TaxID=43992 RepID=UPI0028967382|nr:malonate decarboxylase subunit alpha [Bradyrhizobium liaoningense]